jgi:hypothetical protein
MVEGNGTVTKSVAGLVVLLWLCVLWVAQATLTVMLSPWYVKVAVMLRWLWCCFCGVL